MPQSIKEYTQFVTDNLAERLQQEQKPESDRPNRKDMLHYLFHAKDPATGGPGYGSIELYEETDMLTVAGSDTTSGALAALIFYLVHNDSVRAKLTYEIRSIFSSYEEIRSGPGLASCEYLVAVINETLRMSPPGASEMLREVLPGGLVVENNTIPAGFNVGSPIYALHHDPEIFVAPFSFRPERWIVDENNRDRSKDSVERAEAAFHPFLMGIRGCPGRHLAKLELSIIAARLLFKCEIRAVSGDTTGEGRRDMMWGRRQESQYQTRDALVPLRKGPIVQVRLRFTSGDEPVER